MPKTKKRTTKSSPSSEAPVRSFREPTRVSIEKATNGFVVESYTGSGRVVQVAKSKAEANRIALSMLKV